MEFIRKTILQALTTGKTGNDIIIIPDLTKIYYFKVLLTQDAHHWGFFDSLPIPYYGYGYDGYGNDVNDAYGMGESLLMNDLYI